MWNVDGICIRWKARATRIAIYLFLGQNSNVTPPYDQSLGIAVIRLALFDGVRGTSILRIAERKTDHL